ncbi:hypothetical protein D9M68_696140 [compost metagenome]
MVRAGERLPIAMVFQAHLIPTVRATIEQQMDLPLRIAGHDHCLRTDRLQNEIVRIGHLADMPDVDPGAIPDLLQFLLEDLLIGIERTMHPVMLNQGIPVTCGDCSRHCEPLESDDSTVRNLATHRNAQIVALDELHRRPLTPTFHGHE